MYRILLLLALVALSSCALTPMHKAGKAELDATLENWLDTYDDDFDEALSPDEVTKLADAMMSSTRRRNSRAPPRRARRPSTRSRAPK